jgi:ParB/RepB/Spo0J family partition protein
MLIPVDKILPNPQQPRLEFNQVELQELAASIKENGLIQPVVVEQAGDSYILIDGERRWRACKLLGLTEINASIRQSGADEKERRILAMVANLQRADLNPMEEARSYQVLSKLGMSNAAIAHRLGVSGPRVVSRLALLGLPDEVQDLVAAGLLPVDPRMVHAIRSLPDDHQVTFARSASARRLNIKSIQTCAEKILASMQAEKVHDNPVMVFAIRKEGRPNHPNWDALHQLGKLPPWQLVVNATRSTCKTCVLRSEASVVVCGSCPVVDLLADLIRSSHD